MLNSDLFNRAKISIPGGVNSPVRSFNSVGGTPFFTDRAKECYLYDVEGNAYIDYICSWGANIVGHANPMVEEKVIRAIHKGFSFGTPTELEVVFVEQLTKLMPSLEKVRLVSSGTEAVMSAIRLARGFTNKKYVIKFNGCYHGHSDNLLVKAGSGLVTFNNPSSKGVLSASVEHTLVLEYNAVDELIQAFHNYPDDIACVILEPFAGNMNLVRPEHQFLAMMQKLCKEHKSLLIFDEVMTGFRVSLGGAQELLCIKPDLTTLAKVIGGGMPLAAFGGRAEIMDYLAPDGDVYQAGTLSGNPIAVTCGLANLEIIQQPGFYSNLSNMAERLTNGLSEAAKKHNIQLNTDYVGGMFGLYFNDTIPGNLSEVKSGNLTLFKQFFHQMLGYGIYFAPSMFEVGFLSSAHTIEVIDKTIEIADTVFTNLK